MHTHLCEGENAVMLERKGMRSAAWCEKIGFLGPDVWFAHGWELLPEEYSLLGQTGCGVSHCPAPAILGGRGIIDIPAMQDAGIRVSLGCDGSATNDGSSLMDAMRLAYVMQSSRRSFREKDVTPYDILKTATIHGANTLGRYDLGSLEPEKAADLFMIDTGTLEMCGALHDPKNILSYTAVTGPVWLTMINGTVVYKENQLMNIDERDLARKGEAVCDKVLRNRFDVYKC